MAGGRYGLALDGCRGVREQHPRRAQLQARAVRDCTTRDSIDRRTIKRFDSMGSFLKSGFNNRAK